MKICRSCSGKGVKGFDLCEACSGEGIDPSSTFTKGRVQHRKSAETEFGHKEKQIKFDKKNATRLI